MPIIAAIYECQDQVYKFLENQDLTQIKLVKVPNDQLILFI